MTDKDIINIFKARYPMLKIYNYKSCWASGVNNVDGLIIGLDNGDVLIYFPKTSIEEVHNDR